MKIPVLTSFFSHPSFAQSKPDPYPYPSQVVSQQTSAHMALPLSILAYYVLQEGRDPRLPVGETPQEIAPQLLEYEKLTPEDLRHEITRVDREAFGETPDYANTIFDESGSIYSEKIRANLRGIPEIPAGTPLARTRQIWKEVSKTARTIPDGDYALNEVVNFIQRGDLTPADWRTLDKHIHKIFADPVKYPLSPQDLADYVVILSSLEDLNTAMAWSQVLARYLVGEVVEGRAISPIVIDSIGRIFLVEGSIFTYRRKALEEPGRAMFFKPPQTWGYQYKWLRCFYLTYVTRFMLEAQVPYAEAILHIHIVFMLTIDVNQEQRIGEENPNYLVPIDRALGRYFFRDLTQVEKRERTLGLDQIEWSAHMMERCEEYEEALVMAIRLGFMNTTPASRISILLARMLSFLYWERGEEMTPQARQNLAYSLYSLLIHPVEDEEHRSITGPERFTTQTTIDGKEPLESCLDRLENDLRFRWPGDTNKPLPFDPPPFLDLVFQEIAKLGH